MSVVSATWEAEAGELFELSGTEVVVSPDCAAALQPPTQSEALSQKIKTYVMRACGESEIDFGWRKK